MSTLYKVSNLNKSYKSLDETVKAAVNINLEIDTGDFVMIFGPSGSGKTSLLNLLSGLDTPDSGEIIFKDKNFKLLKDCELTYLRRFNIGVIFQSFELIPVMTSYENIEYPLLLQKIPKAERKLRIMQITEALKIDHLLKRKPSDISGGQKQRIAIARTLVARPDVILGDEITGSLDSHTTQLLYEILKEQNKKYQQSFVTVSHDKTLEKYATKVYHLIDGELLLQN